MGAIFKREGYLEDLKANNNQILGKPALVPGWKTAAGGFPKGE